MINVLQRLAELDAGNPNVKSEATFVESKTLVAEEIAQLPELQDLSTLKALSGLKTVNECGPMGMMGGPAGTPASFSINASAASGDEVAGMLTQIMNLAGVVKGQPDAGPTGPHDGGVLTAEPQDKGFHGGSDASDAMRASLDKLNAIDDKPEDEGSMDLALAGPGTAELGTSDEGPVGGEGGTPDVGDMADEVRDMADQLADTSKEEIGLESYDNTPENPLTPPPFDPNKFAQNANAGGVNKGVTNQPSAMTLEDQLYADYKAFVSEGKDEFGKGKNFAKISKSAGGGEKGDRIAGAIRAEKIKKAGGVKYAK